VVTRRHLVLALGAACAAARAQNEDALRQQQQRLQEFSNRSRAPELLPRLEGIRAASRFAAALRLSGLAPGLQDLPELTVFVPLDEGWAAVPPPGQVAAAQALVRRHVVAGAWGSANEPGARLATLAGTSLETTVDAVGGVPYELQGLRIRNGVLHLMAGLLP